ncbi:MAG: hypothetical protein HFI34_04370 [Lachnospiraceae bacterium]|nr:hypothetical protein [Lachnospiraceae bacterium]
MKKKVLFTGLILISIIIVIGIILIPTKTKLNLKSEKIVCIRIENYNKSIDITEPSEIEKIIGSLNTLSYKKKHPYKKYLDILTGKDNGFISENIYRISLFTEKREHYVYRDGWKRILLSMNGTELCIDSVDYRLTRKNTLNFRSYLK